MSVKRTVAGIKADRVSVAPLKRLSPALREKMIVEEAIRYFLTKDDLIGRERHGVLPLRY